MPLQEKMINGPFLPQNVENKSELDESEFGLGQNDKLSKMCITLENDESHFGMQNSNNQNNRQNFAKAK